MANADASNDILQRGSNWINTNTLFKNTTDIQDDNGLFIFTTFTGKHTAGHWHLTIIERQDTKTRGYIIDSYRQNQDRFETSKAIGADLFTKISDLEYINTPKQFELECGARTFVTIKEILRGYNYKEKDFKNTRQCLQL